MSRTARTNGSRSSTARRCRRSARSAGPAARRVNSSTSTASALIRAATSSPASRRATGCRNSSTRDCRRRQFDRSQQIAFVRAQEMNMQVFPRAMTVLALIVALAGVCIAPTVATAQEPGKTVTTPSGLKIIDTQIGTGATPRTGQTCVMHYTGWLYQNGAKGQKFDSSLDRRQPFEFPIGRGQVIPGWDEGVASMKVGGKRTLIIPPNLGYGARGVGNVIPPNSTLIFEVELLGVKG